MTLNLLCMALNQAADHLLLLHDSYTVARRDRGSRGSEKILERLMDICYKTGFSDVLVLAKHYRKQAEWLEETARACVESGQIGLTVTFEVPIRPVFENEG